MGIFPSDSEGRRRSSYQCHGVFGYHQFLIGRDDAYRHFAVRCGDDGFVATYGIVFGFVERYAQIVQTVAESFAHVGLVFSHASGEEDDVHPCLLYTSDAADD